MMCNSPPCTHTEPAHTPKVVCRKGRRQGSTIFTTCFPGREYNTMGSLLLYVFVVVRSMLGVVVAAASPDSDDENEWCWDDKYCQYKMSMWWCCCICLCCSIVLCCCRDFSGAVLHSVRRGSGFFVINKHILSRNISPGFFFPGSKLLLGSYPPNVHLLDQM